MGHSTKITLHGIHFETRTALRAHLRRMRHRWYDRGPVTGRDHDFLLALFAHHPEGSLIAPSGVGHFEVHDSPRQQGGPPSRPCLWIVDCGGATTPMSMAPAVKAAYLANPYMPKRGERTKLKSA